MTGRNGRSSLEWQVIVAFRMYQWNSTNVAVKQIDHHQVENTGTNIKVLQKRPRLHNQTAKNTLYIIPQREIIKRNNKTIKHNKNFPYNLY
jgi:hypothetical protein